MSITNTGKGEEVLITVNSSSLAGDEAAELKVKAVNLIESGVTKIHLDLLKPEYIDSSGIGKLLFINKKIEKLKGEFSIIKINRTLYDFLESLAITDVMNITKPS